MESHYAGHKHEDAPDADGGGEEFYELLMVVPGARSAVQNWNAARFQAISSRSSSDSWC